MCLLFKGRVSIEFLEAATMGDTALEKTADELRHEIDELHRQQREVLSPPQSLSQSQLINLCLMAMVYSIC